MAKKLRKFLILLDNESLLYFPGSFLTGRVLVDLDEDTAVTGLYFHIVGEGVVRLSDRGSGSSHNDKENYIDFRMKLLGENNRAEGIAIIDVEDQFRFRKRDLVGVCPHAIKEPDYLAREADGLDHPHGGLV